MQHDPARSFTLINARIVTPSAVFSGALPVTDGLIGDIDGTSRGQTIDAGGDYIIPGLIWETPAALEFYEQTMEKLWAGQLSSIRQNFSSGLL